MPRAAKTAARVALMLAGPPMVAAILAGCDAAPAEPGAHSDSREVTVVGTSQVQGTPDMLTASVSIEFAAPDVTAAMNQTSERLQSVIDALLRAGVERKDISTTSVNLRPQYGGEPPAITEYRARNAIDVTIRDLNSASRVLAQIVTTGGDAARINSVKYSIEDDSQLVRDARARAYDDAQDRAEQYAQLSGMTLGEVISISESDGSVPAAPLPAPRGAIADAVPLEPGQQTVGFTVTVMWELVHGGETG